MKAGSIAQLAIAATVGTANREVELDLPAPVAAELPEPSSETAAGLLDAAALLTAAGRVGAMLVEADGAAVEPAPERRPAPTRYTGPMTQLLQGARAAGEGGEAVVIGALGELDRAGGRLPNQLLVPMLDWVAAEWNRLGGGAVASSPAAVRRAAVLPVLGERGRWLAGLDPVWSQLVACDTTEVTDPFGENSLQRWHTGSTSDRVQWLSTARRAHPDRAREILEVDLPTEGAQARADLLAALADTLVPGDEPMLEAALDDRSKKVAAVAASLLRRLPQSAWVTRAVERLVPLLRKGITGWKVSEPSGSIDAGAARDQVDATTLAGLFEAVPVIDWGNRLPPTLERILKVAPDGAAAGLLRATVIDRDVDAARLMLGRPGSHPNPDAVVRLAPLLPESELEEMVMAEHVRLKPAQFNSLLDRMDGDWPDRITQTVLAVADGAPTRHQYGPAERARLLERVEGSARIGGPVDHVAAVRIVYQGADKPALQRAASKAARTLTLRQTLQERLAAMRAEHR